MTTKTIFEASAFEDFQNWQRTDRRTYKKIIQIIKIIKIFSDNKIKNIEPLEGQLKGYWSAKIDEEHRLVYKLTSTEIIIIACRYHYI